MIKVWATVSLVLITPISAPAEAGPVTDNYIAQKRFEAETARDRANARIEALRDNKGQTSIIATTPTYRLEDLETASGNVSGKNTNVPEKIVNGNKIETKSVDNVGTSADVDNGEKTKQSAVKIPGQQPDPETRPPTPPGLQ